MGVIAAAKSMFRGSKADLAKAFAGQQTDALARWRAAVAAHAAGRPIDLGELTQVGPQIGVPQAKLAATFSRDVEVWQQAAEYAKDVIKAKANAAEADRLAAGGREEVERLQAELAAATQRLNGLPWAHAAAAFAERPLHALKCDPANARLWNLSHDVSPERAAETLSLPVSALEVPAGVQPEAEWETD
jgi:hypothetical protein